MRSAKELLGQGPAKDVGSTILKVVWIETVARFFDVVGSSHYIRRLEDLLP